MTSPVFTSAVLLLSAVFSPDVLAADCDCAATCCAQTMYGQVCADTCQRECAASTQACHGDPTTLHALPPPAAGPAADGSLLQPGWQAIAEQAMGDIRAVVLQVHPAATDPALPVSDNATGLDSLEAFARPRPAASGDNGQAIVASLWQAANTDQSQGSTAADRVARAFSLGNATNQLAHAVYGGPPAAAAYAAWWAYRQPGATLQQALQQGVHAGAGVWAETRDANGQLAPPPVVQRSTLAAALGGIAVAAGGGDERTLRQAFYDTGAVLLVQDGSQLYCWSALVECSGAQAKAGIALGQLPALAAQVAVPVMRGPATLAMPLATGSQALGQGWTLGWHVGAGVQRGTLWPVVVLARGTPALPATTVATAPPVATEPVAPAVAPGRRYECDKAGETRVFWVETGQAGSVCRTLYQIGGNTVVLWNAQQNPQVCQARLDAGVKREQANGYRCQAAGL